MPNPKNVHVLPNKANGNWRVQSEGTKRAAGVYNTKAEAKTAGTAIAKKSQGEVFFHNQDGRISNRNSFGHDPFPPRDKKH